ncbi:MAG: GAF domain-containing protein [Bacteroidales bacterium]|nr:GAF domain-containing protein [Bacteroidales bacterium]
MKRLKELHQKLIAPLGRLTLQQKATFLLVGTMLALLGLVSSLSMRAIRISSIERGQLAISDMAEQYASEIRNELADNLHMAHVLARTVERVGFSEAQPYSDDLTSTYREVVASDPNVVALWDSRYLPALNPQKYTAGHTLNLLWRERGQIHHKIDTNNVKGNSPSYQQLLNENADGILEPYAEQFGGQKKRLSLITSVYSPVRTADRKVAGFIGIDILLEHMNERVELIKPYKNSYAFIISNTFKYIAHPNTDLLGHDAQEQYGDIFAEHGALDYISNGNSTLFEATDIYGRPSYFAVHPITVGGGGHTWSLVLVSPTDEVLASSNDMRFLLLLVGLSCMALTLLLFVYMLRKHITKPIQAIATTLKHMNNGDIERSALSISPSRRHDELGQISSYLNKTIRGLSQKVDFAKAIGQGHYETTLDLLSSDDILGQSLIEMRTSLCAARDEEQKRQSEDAMRRWLNEGQNRMSELLRSGGTLKELSFSIIRELVDYLKANQGGIFIANDDNPEEPFFEMTAAYAYNRQKYITKRIMMGEGLVGSCAMERQTTYLTEVPEDYIAIASGLGSAKPRALLIVPLVANDMVLGVIELASFLPFEPTHIEFVEKSSASIAQTLSTTRTQQRTQDLLSRTQQQAEEMKAQEEELRQNLEELEAIKEEVEKQNDIIRTTQTEIEQEQMLLQAIMHNLPENLYFKDLESRYIMVSQVGLKGLGISNMQEIKGKTNFDIIDQATAQSTYDVEQRIIRTNMPLMGQEEQLHHPGGMTSYRRTSQLPLHNMNGEVVGVFGYSQDITRSKQLEAELAQQRQAAQDANHRARVAENDKQSICQAMYNSAFVAEYTPEGYVTFINEAYTSLLQLEASEIVGKHHSYLMDFTDEQQRGYNDFWKDLNRGVTRVVEQRCSANGQQFLFHETYTPIFNENAKVYKIIKIAINISHLLPQQDKAE